MAGGGNKKGTNSGGGMIKGQRKGETRQQAMERMGLVAKVRLVEEVKQEVGGVKAARDVLSEAMNYFYSLAALYQPVPGNTNANEAKFQTYLREAAKIAKDLMPVQTPRLSNTILKGDADAPIKSLVEVLFVDGRGNPVSPSAAQPAGEVRAAVVEASAV